MGSELIIPGHFGDNVGVAEDLGRIKTLVGRDRLARRSVAVAHDLRAQRFQSTQIPNQAKIMEESHRGSCGHGTPCLVFTENPQPRKGSTTETIIVTVLSRQRQNKWDSDPIHFLIV